MELIDKTPKEVQYTVKLSHEEMLLVLAASYVCGDVLDKCEKTVNSLGSGSSIHPYMQEIRDSDILRAGNRLYDDLREILG